MRFAILIAGAALAAAPAPSQTPTTPPASPAPGNTTTPAADPAAAIVQPAVGVTVLDPAGVPVGTIKSIDAQYVTLDTDAGEARLPVAGVGPGHGGAAIGLTKAQIDAAVTQAKAAASPAGSTTKRR